MDVTALRILYAALFGISGILHLYNARRYASLVRLSFLLEGVVFLTFSVALLVAPVPSATPLVALINASVLGSFLTALITVQVIMALNGLIDPLRRRKGD